MRSSIVLLAMLVVSPGALVHAEGNEREARVAALFAKFGEAHQPGCAVSVMRNGQVIHSSAYGEADIAKGDKLTTHAVFNLASISKQFTAFAVLLLEQRKQLSLDDSVTKYLPELGSYAAAITLGDLMHHTSGLRDYLVLLDMRGRQHWESSTQYETVLAMARQSAGNTPPGVAFDYSNTGYMLLSTIVERVSGQSLREFSRVNIFEPLGMKQTSIVDRYPANIAELPRGYSAIGGTLQQDEALWEQTGDGQVHSSLADLARWDENFYTGAVGGKELIHRLQTPGRLRSGEALIYAGGLNISTHRGLPTVEHGGSWVGYRSYLLRFPQQHFSVALLCNRSDLSPNDYAKSVADIYLEDRMDKRSVIAARLDELRKEAGRASPLAVPVGSYRNARTADYVRLSREQGRPVMEVNGRPVTLEPVADLIFSIDGNPNMSVTFHQEKKGKVSAPSSIVIHNRDDRNEYVFVPASTAPDLAAIVGRYWSDEAMVRHDVVMRDGNLFMEALGESTQLRAGQEHELVAINGKFTLHFQPGRDGATELLFYRHGLQGLPFHRMR